MNPLITKTYPYLPVWAQNLAISAFGWSYKAHRLGGRFAEYDRGFREREHWTPARFEDYTTLELRRILKIAFDETPYYKKRWSTAGFCGADFERFTVEDLAKLPALPKNDLRADPDALVSRVQAVKEKLYRYPTSGSTGTPITAICNSDARRKFVAGREARSFAWAGTSIRMSRSMIGGRKVVPDHNARPPYYRYNYFERQTYFSAYHMSAATAPDYVEGFNRHHPELLTGYSHSHYFLARNMIELGIRLNYQPKALVLSSEKLTPEMKQVMQRAFGARAFEEYGTTENCALATECEHGNLHVSPDFGIVEIVDEDGQRCAPGVAGRILCTGLLNDVQPLIRYEVGDLAAWKKDPCPCGRNHLPVLEAIEGRLEDVVIGPDGREMVRFHGLFIDVPGLIESQVIQERIDCLRIRVVVTREFGAAQEKLIRDRIYERLGPIETLIDRVPEIERTSRGKYRAVINKLPEAEKQAARLAARSFA